MAKILKNTTLSDIDIFALGRRVPASGQLNLDTSDFIRLSSDDTITEITSLINSGDLVVNNGSNDLSIADALEYIKYPDQAKSILFDNSTAQLPNSPTNVQSAIEDLKNFRFQYLQFQFIGNLNFDAYLFSNADVGSIDRESGNISNGYQFNNSAPLLVAFTGTVDQATASIRGVAQSTGAAAPSCELLFELWKVGFSGEGTKLGDITFAIDSSSYTIGTFWNSSVQSEFAEAQSQNVSVTAGDLLGLKFIRQTGNDKIVATRNTTIVLQIQGNT